MTPGSSRWRAGVTLAIAGTCTGLAVGALFCALVGGPFESEGSLGAALGLLVGALILNRYKPRRARSATRRRSLASDYEGDRLLTGYRDDRLGTDYGDDLSEDDFSEEDDPYGED